MPDAMRSIDQAQHSHLLTHLDQLLERKPDPGLTDDSVKDCDSDSTFTGLSLRVGFAFIVKGSPTIAENGLGEGLHNLLWLARERYIANLNSLCWSCLLDILHRFCTCAIDEVKVDYFVSWLESKGTKDSVNAGGCIGDKHDIFNLCIEDLRYC